MKVLTILTSALAAASLSFASSSEQSPLGHQYVLSGSSNNKSATRAEIRNALRIGEIIPDVIDDVYPTLLLNVTWHHKNHTKAAKLGNDIKPKHLKKRPSVLLGAPRTKNSSSIAERDGTSLSKLHAIRNNLVFVITDPDAPSRILPDNSEFCHWIAVGIEVDLSDDVSPSLETNNGETKDKHKNKDGWLQDLVSYRPPAPPAMTGRHRYALLAYMPKNATAWPLNLLPPSSRKHWGYGVQRHGVRDWAEEMGLQLLGANFIYAEKFVDEDDLQLDDDVTEE